MFNTIENGSVSSALDDVVISLSQNETEKLPGIMTDEMYDIFMVINCVILLKSISIFGVITNTINIIIFFKHGFKDSVNIALFALAISDFGSCAGIILLTICFNPWLKNVPLPFNPKDLPYLTSCWVHIAFTRLTSCFTAFITFERCLCVIMPLKIKAIFNPKKVKIILFCITIGVICCIIPVYFEARLVWEFQPDLNRSILVNYFSDDYQSVLDVQQMVQGIFLPFFTFTVVLVSTTLLVLELKEKAKWRESTSKSAGNLSQRDVKISRMVVLIAILFIVSFVPVAFSYITSLLVPEYRINQRYTKLFITLFLFHFVLENINSSMNIFIYYRMSSKYKATFQQLFGIKPKAETTEDSVKS